MKFETRDMALSAVFAALYAVLVAIQGLSAAATIQLRFADCLIPLSALFGWPAIVGVSLGCVVGNATTSAALPNGIYDVAFGPVANLIATSLIYVLRNRRLLGCVIGSMVVGVFVGSYIWMIFGVPSNFFGIELPATWPIWVTSIVIITASSLVAIAIIGYTLLTALSKPNIIEALKSKGLKVVAEK
ncbi:MAG: QueT transporter family protein [Candidatus Bathyarchaeota archaeon]|nr:QueT transporter family protein [Candidatus Bathyarchaeota archaeon]MDI6805446.1 QueT transporter family protein [Candidatus Bathyarchaeia archaeon]